MIQLLAKPVTDLLKTQLKERVHAFISTFGRKPKIVVVLIGDDPASRIYTSKKAAAATELNIDHETIHLPSDTPASQVKTLISHLNSQSSVDGILIQRPLPPSFIEAEVVYWISPEKDVDAFHPIHAGRLALGLPTLMPCTPAGVMELLKHYPIQIQGRVACVIGRSSIVGKPMASLLLQAHATVLHCHRQTPDLKKFTKQADLLVVAAGQPEFIDRSYVREGAVVIDVGIHRTAENRIVGDVRFDDVAPISSAISPVPGGVGPMTILMLMQNTLLAAERRQLEKTT